MRILLVILASLFVISCSFDVSRETIKKCIEVCENFGGLRCIHPASKYKTVCFCEDELAVELPYSAELDR